MAHKTNPIENHVNFIDSRDIIQRINYLESYNLLLNRERIMRQIGNMGSS